MPKNREEVRKRFAHQPNGVPCGVFLHTFLHRLWKSFALMCGKWERECGLAPALLAPPCRCCPRRGRGGFGRRLTLPLWCLKGWLAFFAACLPCLQFIFLPPIPPTPFPGGEGGDSKFVSPGASPLASPGLNPGGTGAGGVSRAGGEACPGVARSTCRRCLRLGGLPSLPPAYSAFSFLLYPLSPRPPSPAGKGETQSLFRRGRSPRHPGTEPLAALTEPAKQVPSGGELARHCRLPPPPSPAGGRAPTFFFPCLDRRGGL